MENQSEFIEELVVVGSRYGDLADVVKPLYEKGEPIDQKDIKDILGDEEVILSRRPNPYDEYAVAVLTPTQRLLGFLWMYQSPSVCVWLEENGKDYVTARLTRMITNGGIIIATLETPQQLKMQERVNLALDMDWAGDLPASYTTILEQSLTLGLVLLKDALDEATEWTELLQRRVDNLLRNLPLDLSAHNSQHSLELFTTMVHSPIKEVRQQGEIILNAIVSLGSEAQMTWWTESWLPNLLKTTGEEMLPIYLAADYTLEKVEKVLSRAPNNLFYMFKADRKSFANHLYYSALPQTLYSRLLTLLSVREAMIADGLTANDKAEQTEELFHFIHPEVEDDEALRIHKAIKRLVAYQKFPEICAYLKELQKKGRVLLPLNPGAIYQELVRLGLPTGEGYTEKHFRNCYIS